MKKSNFKFDPFAIARLEAAGWKAYYDRAWIKMLRLLVQLCREQFRMPLPMALLASYYTVRASVAWVPVDHNLKVVEAYYAKFYRLARRYSGLNFDPSEVAHLEVAYCDVHRRLNGNPDKSEFIEVLSHLHAALFGLSSQQTRESAYWRVQANNMVDLINQQKSGDNSANWLALEENLQRCYNSLLTALEERSKLAATAAS